MQSIGAKVQVGNDRRVTLQLPDSLPQGEYEVMLVWSPAANESINGSEPHEDGQAKKPLSERWEQWFAEVDELPLKENSEEKSFYQHLVEKHRKQGLNL